jgi:CspA family cold shock protein
MLKGKVKWFDNGKGYGFIVPEIDKEEGDVFVHHSVIGKYGFKTLHDDQMVWFKKEQRDNGWLATHVMPVLVEDIEIMEKIMMDIVSHYMIIEINEFYHLAQKFMYSLLSSQKYYYKKDANVPILDIQNYITWDNLNEYIDNLPSSYVKPIESYLKEINYEKNTHDKVIQNIKID